MATLVLNMGRFTETHLSAATTLPGHATVASSQNSIMEAAVFTATQMLAEDMASGVMLGARPENVTGLAMNIQSWLSMPLYSTL